MDRSNSLSSDSSTSSRASSYDPFPYQTRLLERTSSLRSNGSLSRSNSQTAGVNTSVLNSTPSSNHTVRKWNPTHRVSNSVDAVRGKWEERAKAELLADNQNTFSSRSATVHKVPTLFEIIQSPKTETKPSAPSSLPLGSSEITDNEKTPSNPKRYTIPAPIVTSAYPSGIGVVDNDEKAPFGLPTPTPDQIYPLSALQSSSPASASVFPQVPSASSIPRSIPPSRFRRSNTVESISTDHAKQLESAPFSSNPSRNRYTPAPLQRRPMSLYGNYSFNPPSPDKASSVISSSTSTSTSVSASPERSSSRAYSPPSPSPPPSSMSPTPYKSSYMANKKKSLYSDQLSAGRRLGRHLPRIASGDAGDEAEAKEKYVSPQIEASTEALLGALSEKPLPIAPRSADDFAGEVVGIPGRKRFSRDKAPMTPNTPLPSSLLSRSGLWADRQRHLLLAYEYLCHVGEAQQWIEGCLGEELGFGVVELEEGLRNGVVLAKLVRKFQGSGVVRRIYEAPKLDYRHSDNINHFFNFVRDVGLPECFVFELTDLYDKKNLPKVIYCIHALSHLLSRRGLAERIGNLLGHLRFSDDQLQRTQKGLKESGLPMPNFSDVGRQLAKEINEEPEVEVETEDERRDRLLLENEASIIAAQCLARGFLVRKAQATKRVQIRLAERYISKVQAHCRGLLARNRLEAQRRKHANLRLWAIALQAVARSFIVRKRLRQRLFRIKSAAKYVVRIQAQARGVIQRRRFANLKAALNRSRASIVRLQSLSRARATRIAHKELKKTFAHGSVKTSVLELQAQARGALARNKVAKCLYKLKRNESAFVVLQAHCRGVIVRRRMKAHMAKLEDVTHIVVRIQTAVRTYLARRRLLALIRSLRKVTPVICNFQAQARANLMRQHHKSLNKTLATVQVAKSVHGFQALARAALTRMRHREQQKQLNFFMPDVVGIQTACRGALVRLDYFAWRDHLWNSQPVAIILQAMFRGLLQRKKFHSKLQYYQANLGKVVKIQSLFRAKETREQYRQLTMGKNVSVGTIKNFVHLLDDSEADFQEEIRVERLRKKVVENIRECQALEHEVSELDIKIALVVQNVKSFEDLIKARRLHGADNAAAHAARASVLAAHGDPFSGPNTLDHAAKRKLELYQQLFYLLQTQSQYLCRLSALLSTENASENNRRLTERVVLTLFGYGQDRREHYLLLKLLQHAIQDEINSAPSIESIVHNHPFYLNIAMHYVRPKQLVYVREALQSVICEVISTDDLDLETDPSIIHRDIVEKEEMRSGRPSSMPKEIPFYQALEGHPSTRAEYIRHLQILQSFTEAFMTAITDSTKKMPYGMRFLAREILAALRIAFPDVPTEALAACVARVIFYRHINPAIITPETFNIVANVVSVGGRKNLAQISKILAQIAAGSEFGEDAPACMPINLYVQKAISQMMAWAIDVANVPDVESQFHAHEFLDATVQPKPIYITPNEVYAMHALLSEHLDTLAPQRDDTLRVILSELNGVPHFGSDELKDARDRAITLELTNRFAHVRDPQAEEKALWVQAKRGVLAILRVQPAQDLVESLMRPVTDDEEEKWDDILQSEIESEQMKQHPGRMPSATGPDAGYRLEDIRSLTFKEVKAHTIFFLLELEKQGKVTRSDGFQGILNAIAMDVRSKHRKRVQRQQTIENMHAALKHLAERKKYFEEQINSYHNYVEVAMNTMQRAKGKKRFVLPFTKQYFHLRELQKAGKPPAFGSFKYGGKDLYEKGILLSIDQCSPRQFDKINLIISSNKPGLFNLELYNNIAGIADRIATTELKMEDLLQAQFENRAALSLFDGMVKVNLSLFLFQINKKFYV